VKFQLSLDASILEIEMYAYGIIEYFRYQQREREREKRNASVPRLINKNFMERISRKFSPFVRLVLSFIYIYA